MWFVIVVCRLLIWDRTWAPREGDSLFMSVQGKKMDPEYCGCHNSAIHAIFME